jgi:hypothetical protein
MGDTVPERRGNVIRGEAPASRFWKIGQQALYLAASFVYLAMYFHPEVITEAFGVFGGVGAMLLGGGTWTNLKERDVAQARVQQAGGGG